MSRAEEGTPGAAQTAYRPPAGATEIIVVRHGASEDLVRSEGPPDLGGRDDPPLSAAGRAQAEVVSARLAQMRFDRVFVTPLQRTAQTVAPLMAARGHTAEAIPELMEVAIGAYEGRAWRDLAANGDPLVERVMAAEDFELIPGSERTADVRARVARGLDHVVERTGPDKVAVLVTHGGIVGEICRAITGSRPFAFVHADNTSITRIVRSADGRWLLRSFNDTTHLTT